MQEFHTYCSSKEKFPWLECLMSNNVFVINLEILLLID